MPDTYVKLPNGQYVQIPEGASPEQLQQMKSRLVQMQNPESNVPDATAQAKQVLQKIPQYTSAAAGREVNDPKNAYMRQSAPLMYGTAGGMVGGSAANALNTAGLPKALALLGKSSALGGGMAAGQLAEDPTNPKAALATAAGTTAGNFALSPLMQWITSSKTLGAKALKQASAKVGNAPVELSSQTNELVDEIVKNEKLGGKPVKAVTDLLRRLGPAPGQAAEAVPGPLSYDEARILQSNLGTELREGALEGRAKAYATGLYKSLGRDVQATANAGGAGAEHTIGMQEYAAASSRNRALIKAGKAAVGSGAAAIGGKILYDLGKNIAAKR